jgi:hypothetical protein
VPVPGPPGVLWATALLVWALGGVVLGEAVRFVGARWVPLWRADEPVERCVLDLYLGGGLLYLVAALPVGAFGPALVDGAPMAAAVGLGAVAFSDAGRARWRQVARTIGRMGHWAPIAAVAAALGLFAVELSTALSAGTGNTFDSSLLTTYVGLLLRHGSIPLTFRPYATPAILYPQGTTVWLGDAQLAFGLPPARSALLVTPLFFALAPLAGFVFGRRMFGDVRGAAAVALSLALLGPATRSLVGGSNDFVLAFPLGLLLAAQSTIWGRSNPPGWGDAVGFGLLAGYSAAINPVGAEWLLPALLLFGLLGGPRAAGRTRSWLSRWGAALGVSLVPVVPSLSVLVRGLRSPGFVPGGATSPVPLRAGITLGQWVGSVDPFLFRPSDVALSPVPVLRVELALLLVAGAILLVYLPRSWPDGGATGPFAPWAVSSGVVIAGWLLLLAGAGRGWSVAVRLSELTSASELSLWLFTLYGTVAAVPLVVALRAVDLRAAPPSPSPPPPAPPARARRWAVPGGPARTAGVVGLGVALAILAPGAVLTPTGLASVERTLYADFGTVSSGDFALLSCAGAHLPPGSRVLVAPGSAAEFLPGYARNIALLYPLSAGYPWANASYRLVDRELANATLDAAGRGALAALGAGYVAVTERNTVLWAPFSPAPFLAAPAQYPVVFHSGDAYLFATAPGAPPFPC